MSFLSLLREVHKGTKYVASELNNSLIVMNKELEGYNQKALFHFIVVLHMQIVKFSENEALSDFP